MMESICTYHNNGINL